MIALELFWSDSVNANLQVQIAILDVWHFSVETRDGNLSLDALAVARRQASDFVSKEQDEHGVPMKSSFQYGEKERDRFNNILKQFVGTHNFHNFMTRIKAKYLAANRFI